jgi:hypothetical protein
MAAMIRTVIRLRNNMVLVFNGEGEQIPEYQGQYADVKERIMQDASRGTVFNHWYGHSLLPEVIPGENW